MNQMTKFIDTWSYSRLADFEQCKLRAKLKYIDKIPEPERPLPKGKTEHANDRGTRVHEACEAYVRGNGMLPAEAQSFGARFEQLREWYISGWVSLEGEWAVDDDWQPTGWMSPEAWGRIKLDAFAHTTPEQAIVIDYKTGRKTGNEIKHAEQMQLYQLACFMRFPELEEVNVELWYLDQEVTTKTRYTRPQGMRFFKNFNRRAVEMTGATEFPPSPSVFTCKWCPYGPRGTGDCTVGV